MGILETKEIKTMWTIGSTGRERRCISALCIFCCAAMLSSCGIYFGYHSTFDENVRARVYDYVDEWPTYNNQPYAMGLMSDFNDRFNYKYDEIEQFQGSVAVELIVSKNGQLLSIRSLIYEDTQFSKDLESFLRACTNWNPGKIHGRVVNTRILWRLTL